MLVANNSKTIYMLNMFYFCKKFHVNILKIYSMGKDWYIQTDRHTHTHTHRIKQCAKHHKKCLYCGKC